MSTKGQSKLLAYHRGKEQKRSSSSLSKAFTAKQSHFARRNEEAAIQQEQFISSTSSASAASGSSENDANNKFDLFGSQGFGGANVNVSQSAASRMINRTTSSQFGRKKVYDLSDLNDTNNNNNVFSSNNQQNNHLGQEIRMERDNDTGEPISGKRARFEDMMERNRDDRAEKKVLKLEQDRETDKLDEEFKSIADLLETKTKKEEAEEAFYQTGSEEVRAKLASFYENRNVSRGREFVLGSNKKLTKLGDDDDEVKKVAGEEVKSLLSAKQQQKAKDLREKKLQEQKEAEEKKESKKNKNKKKEEQEEETEEISSSTSFELTEADRKRVELLKEHAGSASTEDDSFDSLMGQLMFSRKAYATEKVISETDELLEKFQDGVVDLDRMKRDAAGKLVPEVEDVTRREWLKKGGDNVFRMEDDEKLLENERRQQDEDEDEDELDEDENLLEEEFGGAGAGAGDKLNAVDDALSKLESSLEESKVSGNSSPLRKSLEELHEVCALRPRMAAESFRLLFLDIHTQHHTNKVPLSPFSLLILRAATQLFPLTDISRHPVSAPLVSLLPSLMMSSCSLNTPKDAAVLLFLITTMLDLLRGTPLGVESSNSAASNNENNSNNNNYNENEEDDDQNNNGFNFNAQQLLDAVANQTRKPFFASEPFICLCNVLSLQLPLTDLAPRGKAAKIAAPFPLLPRAIDPVLSYEKQQQQQQQEQKSSSSSSSSKTKTNLVVDSSDILSFQDLLFACDSKTNNKIISQDQVLNTAFEVTQSFINDFLVNSPSCPAMLESTLLTFIVPRLQLYMQKVQQQQNNNANVNVEKLEARINKLVQVCQSATKQVVNERAPLAMRTFRPRPLRQYEPLLVNDDDDEMKERRVMKKDLREGKKRMIRTVQAEAAVERRSAERAVRVEDEHRSAKLKNLMSELQGQQHVMNVVDSLRAKGSSKKRKGLSGAPTGDADEGGEGGGGDE